MNRSYLLSHLPRLNSHLNSHCFFFQYHLVVTFLSQLDETMGLLNATHARSNFATAHSLSKTVSGANAGDVACCLNTCSFWNTPDSDLLNTSVEPGSISHLLVVMSRQLSQYCCFALPLFLTFKKLFGICLKSSYISGV